MREGQNGPGSHLLLFPNHLFLLADMLKPLDPQTKKQLAARVKYYKEMGIHDFYRQPMEPGVELALQPVAEAAPIKSQTPPSLPPVIGDKPSALKLIREDIGECTRCRLHKGRTNLVFGVGNVNADLMFVGEGPGADEDAKGEPFVGRAGQLLNNMISAMGIKREDVYIANVVKCRPPENRAPEREEMDVCSPFLYRQIAAIQPKVIVALGATASKALLGLNEPMSALRGRWHEFRGTKLLATYHPAYLLRDPRQKGEAWKDLQMAMKELGLKPQAKGMA